MILINCQEMDFIELFKRSFSRSERSGLAHFLIIIDIGSDLHSDMREDWPLIHYARVQQSHEGVIITGRFQGIYKMLILTLLVSVVSCTIYCTVTRETYLNTNVFALNFKAKT